MADNRLLNNDGGDGGVGDDSDNIFVYVGREQEVPRDVKRVRIAEDVDTIPASTFEGCFQLIEVEGHDKIKKIEEYAFHNCPFLRWVRNMTGVIEIEEYAFFSCTVLSELEFDKLEVIGHQAFVSCKSLTFISMSSVKRVGACAFSHCTAITDVTFGKDLERIEVFAFWECTALRRINIPLKNNLLSDNAAFSSCHDLSRVDAFDGGIHKTISSLHLEMWRNEMLEEINRINQTLPNLPATEKTQAIQQWITRVLSRTERYKTEHQTLLKEAMTLLELTLWKAKLLDEGEGGEQNCKVNIVKKKVKIDAEATRKEHRVTCGASLVIKNVLPFLALS